jgi:hypothetical protein
MSQTPARKQRRAREKQLTTKVYYPHAIAWDDETVLNIQDLRRALIEARSAIAIGRQQSDPMERCKHEQQAVIKLMSAAGFHLFEYSGYMRLWLALHDHQRGRRNPLLELRNPVGGHVLSTSEGFMRITFLAAVGAKHRALRTADKLAPVTQARKQFLTDLTLIAQGGETQVIRAFDESSDRARVLEDWGRQIEKRNAKWATSDVAEQYERCKAELADDHDGGSYSGLMLLSADHLHANYP